MKKKGAYGLLDSVWFVCEIFFVVIHGISLSDKLLLEVLQILSVKIPFCFVLREVVEKPGGRFYRFEEISYLGGIC